MSAWPGAGPAAGALHAASTGNVAV